MDGGTNNPAFGLLIPGRPIPIWLELEKKKLLHADQTKPDRALPNQIGEATDHDSPAGGATDSGEPGRGG